MICLDCKLVSLVTVCSYESVRKVCVICSDVGSLATKLEVEILICLNCKGLTAKGNALNCYRVSNISIKISTVNEELCDINRINSLDCFINDLYEICLIEFLHAIGRRNRTGNTNCHTNLNTIIKWVCVHVVAVVTALAIYVSKEEMVSLVTSLNRVNRNNDTLYCKLVTALCVHVILMSSWLKLRNEEIECDGSLITVFVCCLSCKSVRNVCIVIDVGVNVESDCTGCAVLAGNLGKLNILSVGFDRPCNCNIALKHHCGKFGNVTGSTVLFIVTIVCLDKANRIVCLCFCYFRLFRLWLLEVEEETENIVTRGQCCEAHYKCQKKN